MKRTNNTLSDVVDREEWRREGDAELSSEASRIRPVIKKYNLCKENEEFSDISRAIRKDEPEVIKDKLKKGE